MTIESPDGKQGFHPLTPSIRNSWTLVPFDFPELKLDEQEADSKSDEQESSTPKKKSYSKPPKKVS